MSNTSRSRSFTLQRIAHAALLLVGAQALAQQAPDAKLERIEITGSSIKRLEGETALPVQIFKREDIDKTGATTAAELLRSISASTAPLGDGASITDGTSGQRGFNGANLRGIGVSSTLVLLNGRRLANFASPGDNAGVDLNSIPAGAIQRVEILKDGASAIYGTDAIGGVINFITRKDYRGVDISASVAGTQEGGAGKRTTTLSGGFGDLAKDRFNIFGVLDVQHLDSLRSSQRQFIQDRPLASNLPALMSSNTFPANVDISSGQRNALIKAGVLPAGATRNRINPANPGCNTLTDATVFAAAGPGGPLACSYDYMKDTEIYPEARKIGFVGRATFQLADDHQLYGEIVQTKADTRYVLSPNPQRIRNLPISVLPQNYRDALTANGYKLTDTFSGVRYRMTEAGNRTNLVEAEGRRLLLGMTGVLAGWDYDLGLAQATNTAVDNMSNGYTLFDKLDAGVRNGTVNPFAPSAASKAYLESIKVRDAGRSSKGTTRSLDFKASKALAELAGGEMALALGGELRRENMTFTPSPLLLSNNIAGDRSSSGLGVSSLRATDDSRKVYSAFAELNAPLTKQLEVQLALRYDHYNDAGSTTNPKIGLRYQPTKQLLLRASANTGFRAPSLSDLKRPTTYGTAASFLTDPYCVKNGLDTIDGCTDQWPVERRSNSKLKPEKSEQFSLGAVYEVNKDLNFGIDYWNILKKDVISALGEQVIIDNADKYNGKYIQRDADGFITNILLVKENQGRLKTSGLDLSFDWRTGSIGAGRLGISGTGTWIHNYDRQFGPLESYRSNLGVFLNDQVIQKWRHKLNLNYDQGPVSVTLSNSFSSGYTDQNTTYDPSANSLLPSRKVKAYSLFDLTGSYAVTRDLKLRAGILNLANTAPPFSNQAYYFLAGYDPTYTDPRGRSYYVSFNYSLR